MTALSLAAVLADPARRSPDKTAVIEGDRSLTYAQVWDLACAYAGALVARGVEPGDRVAILAPNTIDFVAAYYGTLAAGGVVVPVPTLLQGVEAGYLVRDSGARLLLAHPALPQGHEAAAAAGVESVDITSLGAGAAPLPTYVAREAEDLAVVFYTSGTTGAPKGAMLTQLNLVMNATVNAFDCGRLGRDDVVLAALPLFHIYGQSVSMNTSFRVGATLVLQPRFEPVEALRIMNKHKVTRFSGVPTMFIQLLRAADEHGAVETLTECTSGGASLPVAVLEQFQQRFGVTVREGFGLSETSPTATTNHSYLPARPGTVGQPIWGCEAEIADPAILDRVVLLPQGERGEVVLRGHNIFAGYLGNPEATATALQDNWFRTGDIGIKDDEGYLRIVDRTKDLIIRGGYNVYPREVEEVLARRADIDQVSVIGIPDDERGEEVCAVVVPAAGHDIDPDELIAWARERLGRHKYPRRVELRDALPMGPSHKVLKRELRQQFR